MRTRNTSGIVVACLLMGMSWLGISHGLREHNRHQTISASVAFLVVAIALAYLVRRRRARGPRIPDAEPDPAYWRRLKVQMYLLLAVFFCAALIAIGLGLVFTFKDHHPGGLVMVGAGFWFLVKVISPLRELRSMTADDMRQRMIDRASADGKAEVLPRWVARSPDSDSRY